jgi:hypothetical protein
MEVDIALIAAVFREGLGLPHGVSSPPDDTANRVTMVRTRQPTIDCATALVDEEIELVEREQEAFERFLARVRETGAMGPGVVRGEGTGGSTLLAAAETRPSERLRAVRTAYRETVMAVPHYEREYGDTLQGSVAAELGETLAGHVADGQVLTPALYDALVEASERARDDRADFLQYLRRERESLRGAASELNDVERRAVELGERVDAASTSAQLASVDESLAALERRCTDLTNRRQATIHNRGVGELSGVDGTSLVQYLYADGMETVAPVLSDAASRLDAIRHQRARCSR